MALTQAEIDAAILAAGLDLFLPPELRTAWATSYVENGQNGSLATIQMREHPNYEQYYPGMLNEDGLPRYRNEAEYEMALDAYQQTLAEAGVDTSLITRDMYGTLVEGMVSPSEFQRRVNTVTEGVLQRGDEVAAFYATNYGIEMNNQAIITSLIDRRLGDAVLNEQVRTAQIGGAASREGFDIGLGTAGQLEDIGIQYQQAIELFQEAAVQIPVLARLTQRHGDENDPFDIGEFLNAAAFGDADTIRSVQNLVRGETGGFTQSAVSADQSGSLSGLTDR